MHTRCAKGRCWRTWRTREVHNGCTTCSSSALLCVKLAAFRSFSAQQCRYGTLLCRKNCGQQQIFRTAMCHHGQISAAMRTDPRRDERGPFLCLLHTTRPSTLDDEDHCCREILANNGKIPFEFAMAIAMDNSDVGDVAGSRYSETPFVHTTPFKRTMIMIFFKIRIQQQNLLVTTQPFV